MTCFHMKKKESVTAGVWGTVQNPQPALSIPYSEIDLQLDDIITQVLGRKILFKIAHTQKQELRA